MKNITVEQSGFCNCIGYSDINPFEITRKISDKTLEIRRMDATIDPQFQPHFNLGGYVGHCDNQDDQKWFYKSNPNYQSFRVRLHKDGFFYDVHGGKYALSLVPKKFHDYNF